jgi:hypothetical protein
LKQSLQDQRQSLQYIFEVFVKALWPISHQSIVTAAIGLSRDFYALFFASAP